MSVDLKPTSSGVTSMGASSKAVQQDSAGPYYDFSKDTGDSYSFSKTSKAKKGEKTPLNDDPSTKGIGNRPVPEESMGSEVDQELDAIRDIEKQALGTSPTPKGKNGQGPLDL